MAEVLINRKKKVNTTSAGTYSAFKNGKYFPMIRSRHPSHSSLRRQAGNLPKLPFRSLIRLGSTTLFSGSNSVELNSIEAIKNSADKLRMKKCFDKLNVRTAVWFIYDKNKKKFIRTDEAGNEIECNIKELPYPIIAKSHFGSRGKGNTKLDNHEELFKFVSEHNINNYIFEVFHNYYREYRLHVTKDGCFYTCRKMLKYNTPDERKWFRNDANCTWFVENNPQFDKPSNWNEIVEESVKALKAVGLDFGAVDVRVQGSTDDKGRRRIRPDFIIIEINSAPSFGKITEKKYFEILPKLLVEKYSNRT